MFGFIKNLFGGIFSFLGGLFGGKKSQDKSIAPKARKASGYFMQLDEAEDNKPAAAPQPASSQPLAEQKKPEPAKVAATAPAQPAKVEPVASAKKPQPTKVEPATEAKKPEPASSAAPAASTNGKVQPQPELTFAPKFLNPAASSNSRRRPGPSLNSFLDMARQVKTPNA